MANYRVERIERLLEELRYEVTRGMLEREIEEELTFRFLVPISKAIPKGIVLCEFKTRPIPEYQLAMNFDIYEPKLKLVPKSKE